MTPSSISWQKITLQLRSPFGLSYGISDTRVAYLIRLANDEGLGEGTIPPYYGIEPDSMTAFWDAAGEKNEPFPDDVEQIDGWIGAEGPPPARCALSLALHDRIARRKKKTLHKLLELPTPTSLSTSYTIGLDSPEEMARVASQTSGFPILKLKLGSDGDLDRFMAVRQVRPDAELYVDANAGWTREVAVKNVRAMGDYGLALAEQPVSKDDIEGLGWVQSRVGVPVVADESLQSLADVDVLAAAGVTGVNVKLMKLGGLGPALTAIRRARELGLRIMLGCMVETSLGVTAMAHLAGLADWLDLDPPFLISNDPIDGLTYDDEARIHLPNRPGIGARLRGEIGGD
ncbi:MAG: dipeptide epimerase [Rhodothermales bacterium]|nr:dipeptide epimerase [Rhodothermales bacterium]